MKSLNWIHKIILIGNIFAGVCLLFGSFSANFSPTSSEIIYLFGLGYPYMLIINLAFVLYWIYHKKIVLLFSLVIILVGYSNIQHLFGFNFSAQSSVDSKFSIMSFNVRLFNQYQWIENENVDLNIFDYIKTLSPDIVAFQEFINNEKKNLLYIKKMKELGYTFYSLESSGRKEIDYFGLATFSKFKIVESGAIIQGINSSTKATAIYTDIQIRDYKTRVYNSHLNSLQFISEDYEFVENITENNDKEALKKSKNIIEKIMVSAIKRQTEVDSLISHIDKCTLPIIVLGDFNDPPYSYAYPQLKMQLQDPFLKHGFGLGTTFDGIATIPGLRLDYILHSSQLTSTNFRTGPSLLSDHRPLMSWFAFPK